MKVQHNVTLIYCAKATERSPIELFLPTPINITPHCSRLPYIALKTSSHSLHRNVRDSLHYLEPISVGLLLGLLFEHEYESSMFLRNVS
jgi:hypothetical protein